MAGRDESTGRRNVSYIPTVTELKNSGLKLEVTLKLWASKKYFYGAEVIVGYIAP